MEKLVLDVASLDLKPLAWMWLNIKRERHTRGKGF